MKTNLLILILIAFFISSCSKDAKLLKDAEKFLLTQLNDPDSYKKDSLYITLRVTQLQDKKDIIHQGLYVNPRVVKSLKETNFNDSVKFKQETADGMKYVNKPGFEKVTAMYKDMLSELNAERDFRSWKIDSLTKVVRQLQQDSINVFSQTDDQQIQRIVFKAIYRAKNKFGGYVKETAWIIWYPEKGFELNSIE